jgi:hypothetical protein
MTRKQTLIALAVLSLGLLVCAVWCFYLAVQCFDGGILWVAVTSSNPHPSETAKFMGPYWMNKAGNWFWSGMGFIALMVVLLIINYRIGKRRHS